MIPISVRNDSRESAKNAKKAFHRQMTCVEFDAAVPYNWVASSSGAPGSITYSGNHEVIAYVRDNGNAAQVYQNYAETTKATNIKTQYWEIDARVIYDSTGIDATTWFIGLSATDNPAGWNRSTNNVVGLYLDSADSYYIKFVTDNGGSEETTDISDYFNYTVVSTIYYISNFTVTFAYDGVTWKCYVNNVLAATHSTQVPTSVGACLIYLKATASRDSRTILQRFKTWGDNE